MAKILKNVKYHVTFGMKSLHTVCERMNNAQITCLALYTHGYYIQVHTPRVAVFLVFKLKCEKIHKKGEGRATGVSHLGKDDGASSLHLPPPILLPLILPSIKVFSSESTLHISWPKDWIWSFSISTTMNIQGCCPLE